MKQILPQNTKVYFKMKKYMGVRIVIVKKGTLHFHFYVCSIWRLLEWSGGRKYPTQNGKRRFRDNDWKEEGYPGSLQFLLLRLNLILVSFKLMQQGFSSMGAEARVCVCTCACMHVACEWKKLLNCLWVKKLVGWGTGKKGRFTFHYTLWKLLNMISWAHIQKINIKIMLWLRSKSDSVTGGQILWWCLGNHVTEEN